MNPIDYKPMAPEEFIGEAKDLFLILKRIAFRTVKKRGPVKVLIHGDPGIGKSALLEPFQDDLGVGKWSLTKLNGTQVKIETIDDWARSIKLTDLFGCYRALRIEEVDKCNAFVQARMLTLLDDLPANAAVLCTSNRKLDDFDPRFVSRFQTFSLRPPPDEEVRWLLKKFGLRKDEINRIATFAAGNVRLALFDAQSALDQTAALKGGAL